MRSKLALVTALFIAVAPAVSATPFDGAYDITPQKCAQEMSDSRRILSGNTMQVWEGQCELSNPTSIREMPNAVLYDAACWQEGERYYRRILLQGLSTLMVYGNYQLSDLIYSDGGYVAAYVRCPSGTTMY